MSRYVTLDFDPVVEGADLPEGTYKVQVAEANPKDASTGSKMIELVMEVIDDAQFNGRRVYDNVVLAKNTAWKILQVTNALGLKASSGQLDLDDWVGRTMWTEVQLDDSGRARPKRYRKA